jgi:hypothetical protein
VRVGHRQASKSKPQVPLGFFLTALSRLLDVAYYAGIS